MPRKFRKTFTSILALIIVLLGSYLYFLKNYPTASPIDSAGYFLEHLLHPHTKLDKHVMGFLPYWRVSDSKSIRPELLSEVNYFSISPDADGSIRKVSGNQTEPGWREFNSPEVGNLIAKTQIMGAEFTLTLVTHENTVIESILDNPNAQDKLITELVQEMKTRNIDGVNIDFEYLGDPDDKYKEAFTTFSEKLNKTLEEKDPEAKLSLSLMPLAVREKSIYNFGKLSPLYDHFIGMSYDFYGVSSDIAGPISPMTGFKDNKFFFDVETMYEDYTKVLPKEKIVMGVPYYGWDWAVEDGKTINSKTLPADDPHNYAAVMSYARFRENKDLKKDQCTWDDYAQETWCWYSKDGVEHQVWLNDEKSLGVRYDYVKKQDFAGVAVWVLTYDKGYSDLWDLLEEKFISKTTEQ